LIKISAHIHKKFLTGGITVKNVFDVIKRECVNLGIVALVLGIAIFTTALICKYQYKSLEWKKIIVDIQERGE
jgi:Mg/Co/Ni transporter MgtE